MFKIAILSNFTCDPIQDHLKRTLSTRGITPEFYLADFNQIATQVLENDSELYAFNPALILILWDEMLVVEQLHAPWTVDSQLNQAITETSSFMRTILSTLEAKSAALIVMNTLLPSEHLLQHIIDYTSKTKAIIAFNHLNLGLLERAARSSRFICLETAVLLQHASVIELRDERLALYASMNFHDSLLARFAHEISHIAAAQLGLTKKVLVVDLDGTLWGGVLGDDGLSGVALGGSDEGGAYQKFQALLVQLKSQGVLLAINSKNERAYVLEMLSDHPEMCLRPKDFVALYANWQPKHQNMQAIAQDLNLNLDSIVFIDDHPAECALIKKYLPEVTVFCLGEDPFSFSQTLLDSGAFNSLHLTQEDSMRTETYHAEHERQALKKHHCNITEYLHDLQIKLRIFLPNALELKRISQLSLRTNQFNLTGLRYPLSLLESLCTDPHFLVLGIEAEDRFGKQGIVGAVFMQKQENALYLLNFLLSCRVFGREIETAVLHHIFLFAQQQSLNAVYADYHPSPKNKLVQDFYPKNGFECIEQAPESLHFKHSLGSFLPPAAWITLAENHLEKPHDSTRTV
jgi:FkbH-like protein